MNKVIDIFRKDEKNIEEEDKVNDSFEEAMKRNEENRERMKKERLKDNKKVLKTYRIKD